MHLFTYPCWVFTRKKKISYTKQKHLISKVCGALLHFSSSSKKESKIKKNLRQKNSEKAFPVCRNGKALFLNTTIYTKTRSPEFVSECKSSTLILGSVGKELRGAHRSVCRGVVQCAAVCFSRGSQLEGDELLESLQVLGVQLDVVVPGTFHPQWLYGARASLVDGQAVREIDHFVLCAVNHEDRRGHL